MILIAFGSNMPFCGRTPVENIEGALASMGRITCVTAISRFYRSPAWPDPSDPPFVNAVASVVSVLSPEELLAAMHAIEAGFGRKRSEKNAPRTLDLDLLAYGDEIKGQKGDKGLILPHPAMAERDFVLAPLDEIAPKWCHPLSHKTAAEMLVMLDACTAKPLAGSKPTIRV